MVVLGLHCFGGLPLVMASRGYSSLRCTSFSLQWLLLLQRTGSRAHRLQSSWCKCPVAPRQVGSSLTRDRTSVPCVGGGVLNHWATREAHVRCFLRNVLVLGIRPGAGDLGDVRKEELPDVLSTLRASCAGGPYNRQLSSKTPGLFSLT